MSNVFDVLQERNFIAQSTSPNLKSLLDQPLTFYIGFDPTADSLHAGHLVQLIAMKHMQQFNHHPICLIGTSTAAIGDPSGRNDLRQMLSKDTIRANATKFEEQISRFIDFNKATLLTNDYLNDLSYIPLLRDIGTHFTVNKMLSAECYKQRYQKGLTFLEFNYMIMQAFDFYHLNKHYNCILQMGGDDQWSNILAGINLIKHKTNTQAYGLTNNLLIKSDGAKMGKTSKGALWLDENKTSPYEFYQYWRNISDNDVKKCLLLLTFLPINEINSLTSHKDERINEAKEILAYEVTSLVHGTTKATEAQHKAKSIFAGNSDNIETIHLNSYKDTPLIDILLNNNIIESKSIGRRLIQQNGISINNQKLSDPNYVITFADLHKNDIIVKIGKKKFYKLSK